MPRDLHRQRGSGAGKTSHSVRTARDQEQARVESDLTIVRHRRRTKPGDVSEASATSCRSRQLAACQRPGAACGAPRTQSRAPDQAPTGNTRRQQAITTNLARRYTSPHGRELPTAHRSILALPDLLTNRANRSRSWDPTPSSSRRCVCTYCTSALASMLTGFRALNGQRQNYGPHPREDHGPA